MESLPYQYINKCSDYKELSQQGYDKTAINEIDFNEVAATKDFLDNNSNLSYEQLLERINDYKIYKGYLTQDLISLGIGDSNGKRNYIVLGHDEKTYSDIHTLFDEQMFNYIALKGIDATAEIEMLRSIFGNEVFDILDSKFNECVYKLSSRIIKRNFIINKSI